MQCKSDFLSLYESVGEGNGNTLEALLELVAQDCYRKLNSQPSDLVSLWKEKLGAEIETLEDLELLIQAKNTWGSIEISPFIKAKIEQIHNKQMQEKNKLENTEILKEEEEKLEYDDKWNELTNSKNLKVRK